MIGKPIESPVTIAELLKASFTFPLAMSKNAPSATANCFLAIAHLMIVKMTPQKGDSR
jgi:hypothetical protein